MKLRLLTLSGALLALMPVMAQDVYEVESLSSQDLNGTARYVGMGGAMNALGADLSTIGSNPAGIGMYRRNDVAVTGSITSQPNGEKFLDINKARTSFDQAGIVFKTNLGGSSLKYINFGFNYQKRNNFKKYVNVSGPTGGASQMDELTALAPYDNYPYLLDAAYDAGAFNIINNGAAGEVVYTPSYNATNNKMKKAQWGYVSQYDFNVSMNFNHQVYVGVTMGVYDVDKHSGTDYWEGNAADPNIGYYMNNDERLTGTGFDVKAGVIVRPIKDNPFRFGLSVATPIWYDLTYDGNAYAEYTNDNWATNGAGEKYSAPFDYKIRTPWKFNVSAATTIGKIAAIDAEYEYSDYSTANVSYPDGWDRWNNVKDQYLKEEIKHNLKGVSTVRVGAEVNFLPNCFVRAGYNYVSSPFEDNASRNLNIDGPAPTGAVGTEYVNLGAINRLTVGLGYRVKGFYMDAAYQYQNQEGKVYGFQSANLPEQKFALNRNNFMLTLGYKF